MSDHPPHHITPYMIESMEKFLDDPSIFDDAVEQETYYYHNISAFPLAGGRILVVGRDVTGEYHTATDADTYLAAYYVFKQICDLGEPHDPQGESND